MLAPSESPQAIQFLLSPTGDPLRRLRWAALACSIAIHLLALSLISLLTVAHPGGVTRTAPPREKLLTFRLVETPASARTEQPPSEAQAVSDKNARAQNPDAPHHLPEGLAYARLKSPLTGDGGQVGTETGQLGSGAQPGGDRQPGPATQDQVASPERDSRLSSFQGLHRPKFSVDALGTPMDAGKPKAGGGQQESRSRFLGDFSLNTYAWDYAPYLLYMKRRLEENLYPPPAFTLMGIISGNVILRFKVMPDGTVEDLAVEEYDCHPSLVECSLLAVKNSSPFRPLPRDFPEPYLELRWKFMYIVYR
ncbi:MAG: energy transducer TonB [candidate division KSB1 bacterium]|nr:energy transducer TonB [candidate division KSB1 bacterium]